MKIKLISFLAVVAAGVLVLLMTVSGQANIESEYNTNIARARSNAEREIPYNAYVYYNKAFEIRCEEAIYKEYLEQTKLLGEDFYVTAVENYVVRFPMSFDAYETMTQMYYDRGKYHSVIDVALEARGKDVASDKVRDLYNECAHMLKTIKSDVDEAQPFLGSYAMVKVNGLYGYIKTNGDFLLAPFYEGASPMMGTNAAVNDGEEWHIINSGGFKVARTSEPVDYMGILVGGKIPVAKNGRYGYATSALIIPENLPYDYASNFKNGVAAVRKGDKWALINTEEVLITEFVFDDVLLDEYETCHNGGVIFVKKNGKYYMANAAGNKITEQGFDDAKPFVGNDPAAVCINGQWGFVAADGNMVIQPQYEGANSFSIGLAGVCIDGLWGYINSSGTIRVPCQFEECKPFSGAGIAVVKQDEVWKYVQLLSYQQ